MANWNLTCEACKSLDQNVVCSMYTPPPCPTCGGERLIAPTSVRKWDHGIFPFTVNHVDGKPMVITDMAHLRSVENSYGVAFSAFNKDNIHDLDGLKDTPKYRGDDPGFRPPPRRQGY